MVLRQSKQNAKRRFCSTIQQLKSFLHQDSNDVCFGKTGDVRLVAILRLSSRLVCVTDARHKITYPLVPYPHTYIALYFLYAKVTCNTQKQEIVVR